MTKTATITKVNGVRTWERDGQTTYYFDVDLDNGDTGSIGKRKPDALREGMQLNYELTPGEYGNRLKEVRPQQPGSGSFRRFQDNHRQDRNAAFALSYAKDIAVAQIAAGRTGDANTQDIARVTLKIAEQFVEFLNQQEKRNND